MNLRAAKMNRQGRGVRPGAAATQLRGRGGFTMIEIALCLAIIGFALVAIIGILPAGMQVQKDNREDTVVNQDAAYWMEAIRNGSVGLDDLTNYVDAIITNNVQVPVPGATYTSGFQIVGLLSTPG